MGKMTDTPPGVNRPGGFEITDRALSFCSFRPGAKIIDLGCGSGATVDHMIHNFGLDASGLDIKLNTSSEKELLFTGCAEDIPMPSSTFDGVLMECSFSMMTDQEKVLKECRRILKTNGRLIISDMYARGESSCRGGTIGQLVTREKVASLLETNGFTIDLFEDFTTTLKSFWGQMIFDNGSDTFYRNLGISQKDIKSIKCGYYLLVAEKKDTPE